MIVLHGPNSDGARIRRRLSLETIARSAKPIFLYPDAIEGHWADAAGAGAKRDVAMLRDLTARLVREGLVNSRRIFLVGDSTGGAMAIRAVCTGLGQPIAGLATIDTIMPANLIASCATLWPVAYIDVEREANSQAHIGSDKLATIAAKTGATASPAAATLFVKLKAARLSLRRSQSVVADPRTRRVAS